MKIETHKELIEYITEDLRLHNWHSGVKDHTIRLVLVGYIDMEDINTMELKEAKKYLNNVFDEMLINAHKEIERKKVS